MARDIVLGLEIDTEQVAPAFDKMLNAINEVSQQVQKSQRDFQMFEDAARTLGVTVEEHVGITTQVADAYREVNDATDILGRRLRTIRIQELAPINRELGELARLGANAAFAFQETSAQLSPEGGGLSQFFGPQSGTALSLLLANATGATKAATRVTTAEALARADREDRLLRRQLEEIESDNARQETLALRQFFLREDDVRRRSQLSGQLSAVDDRLFADLQALDRESFLAQQAVEFQGNVPLQAFRDRQRRQLQAFDIRQQANVVRRELRQESAAERAQIRAADETQRNGEKLDAILLELRTQRQNRIEEAGIPEDIVESAT